MGNMELLKVIKEMMYTSLKEIKEDMKANQAETKSNQECWPG
jgi:hypothetical protein